MNKTEKTTMSVREMGQILGLSKTESYWLVHKQCFETTLVQGVMRVNVKSFEHWYANQIKHKKVDGTPPGEELRSYSYSVQEIADLLGVSDDVVYAFLKRDHIETFDVDTGCVSERTFLRHGTNRNASIEPKQIGNEMLNWRLHP